MAGLTLIPSTSFSPVQQPAQPLRSTNPLEAGPASDTAHGASSAGGSVLRFASDSVGVPAAIEGQASPDLAAALRAAEQARDELLAKGVVPNMSAMDAARLMALLG